MSRRKRSNNSKKNRKPGNQSHNPSKQARMKAQAHEKAPATHGADDSKKPALESSAIVTLDPLAPLVIRSGRPFDEQAGVDPARFPPPSTIAGCLRTAWARETGQSFGPHLATLAVSGPLLVDREGHALVPKPADALYFNATDGPRCVRTEPQPFASGCGADLPAGLRPVQMTERIDGKPCKGPLWWRLCDFFDFRRNKAMPFEHLKKRGWSPGAGDRRTHVAIDRRTGAAKEGMLFQTEGLVLDAKDAIDAAAGGLRLLARCFEPLRPTLVHLGGERRLAALEPEAENLWPTPPSGWFQNIAQAGGLCLTLLTPGTFAAGYRPGWLDAELIGSPPAIPDLRLQLCAVAIERWQAHSGWDLANNRPRPTCKLAPAGTTYWFRILDGTDDNTLTALWLKSASDAEQDRLDGFGLALPSPWTPPEQENRRKQN